MPSSGAHSHGHTSYRGDGSSSQARNQRGPSFPVGRTWLCTTILPDGALLGTPERYMGSSMVFLQKIARLSGSPVSQGRSVAAFVAGLVTRTPADPATFRTGRAPRLDRRASPHTIRYAAAWACCLNPQSSHRADTPRPARCDIRGPWRYYHTRSDPWRQYLPIMMEAPRLLRPVVRGVN